MYPHQVLMDEHNLSKEDLSKEAQEYLKDFNHYHRGISLKESRAIKAGKIFNLSETENSKLNRFSKSVAIKIYEDLQVMAEVKKVEDEKERKIKEEATALAKQQLEEEARIKAENEAKEAQEEEERKLQEEEEERKLEEAEKEKLQLAQEEEERKLEEEEQRLEEQRLEEQILEEQRVEEERLKEEEEIKLRREARAPRPSKPAKQDEGTGLFDYFF